MNRERDIVVSIIEQINSFHQDGLTSEQCAQLFRKLADELDGGVVIFGAMHVGIKIKEALEEYSIKVLCYLDEIEPFDELGGVPVVHSFDKVIQLTGGQSTKKQFAFICSAGIVKSLNVMEKRVRDNISNPQIIDKTALFYSYYQGEIYKNSGIIIKAMCSINTNLCTLRCKGCSTMTPLVIPEMRRNFDVDALINDANHLSHIADAITYFEILGGEPFIHQELDRHIYKLRKIKNIFMITLVTNGTLIPSERTLKAMKECDVIVRISDYGDISKKKHQLVEVLNKWGIVNFMRPANDIPWSDYGEFHDSGDDGFINWKNCRDRGSYVMYDGKLYPCGRIFRQVENKLYDASRATCVDLYAEKEVGRKELRELESRVVPTYGCRWCGNMDKKIEAGVQLP